MTSPRLMLSLGVLLMLTACGGGEPGGEPTSPPAQTTASSSPSPTAACSPEGAELEVEAEGVNFDTSCLAAPADTAFTITFKNKDGVQHNIVIEDGGQFLNGEAVTSGTITYDVDPIPAGLYKFYCKFHPSEMQGQFVAA